MRKEVMEGREITIFFQNFNKKFGYVLHKISTNLLSLIHMSGSLIPLPKLSGVGMGAKVGTEKCKIKNHGF